MNVVWRGRNLTRVIAGDIQFAQWSQNFTINSGDFKSQPENFDRQGHMRLIFKLTIKIGENSLQKCTNRNGCGIFGKGIRNETRVSTLLLGSFVLTIHSMTCIYSFLYPLKLLFLSTSLSIYILE